MFANTRFYSNCVTNLTKHNHSERYHATVKGLSTITPIQPTRSASLLVHFGNSTAGHCTNCNLKLRASRKAANCFWLHNT